MKLLILEAGILNGLINFKTPSLEIDFFYWVN